ncbi:DUF6882 domain-containing protein [Labrys sp. La1]|uniref:DUF6882 domain-containing protein n=1 Tax=Labrys sp. La1 TaxID=3404917 RepID=UPI003EBDA41A
MTQPDWYPDWLHEAVHELQAKNDRLEAEFTIGHWESWFYDLEQGTIIFSQGGEPKFIAQIQVIGSTSNKAKNWLWAWGNSSIPEAMTVDARQAQAFGEEHGIEDLTHSYVNDDDFEALGWELTAVAARLADALGAYRPSDEKGAIYLLYNDIRWVDGPKQSGG